jgi:hypothetical protein
VAAGCHVAASPASSCLYTLLAPFRRCCYWLGMRSLVGRQALHEAIMGGRQSKKACTQPLRLLLLLVRLLLLTKLAPAAPALQQPDACLTGLDDDALRAALDNGNEICGAKPHTLELPADGLAPFDGHRLAPPASDAARRTEGVILLSRAAFTPGPAGETAFVKLRGGVGVRTGNRAQHYVNPDDIAVLKRAGAGVAWTWVTLHGADHGVQVARPAAPRAPLADRHLALRFDALVLARLGKTSALARGGALTDERVSITDSGRTTLDAAVVSLLEAAAIVVAFPPTGFPSFPHLRACPPPMRVAGSPQLTRPGGLVARRYGVLHDTRPHACERLHHRAAPPPFLSP